MAGLDPTGTNWTDIEIDLIVADYFAMLALDLKGEAFVKAHRNEELQRLTGRTRGSIEFKHQNISAVMVRLGLPWLRGYKPMSNFQEALVAGVERYFAIYPPVSVAPAPISKIGLSENDQLFMGPPPVANDDEPIPELLKRLVRKFDPAARDAKNRALGRAGEERVLQSEISRLRNEGRNDLADQVRWVADLDGDGAGFDIRSFQASGDETFLEVKTTVGDARTPFYLSENERLFSEERADAFRIVRLYDFARSARAFEIQPPLQSKLILDPSVWKASFGN